MTVCVTAICAENIIFGASDRMLTAGDIQFQPQQPKLLPITTSVVTQIAGDASIQADIISLVIADVKQRVEAKPTEWLNVRDVAGLYCHYYDELRLARTEHAILAPLGLDRNTWLTKQNGMDPTLVKNIATELMNYEFPLTAAIFSGVDNSRAHIYVARGGVLTCQDIVGFAAIGAGEWHANSQLMFAGHTRHKSLPETLLSVYSAKKRAEVAPGVGEATDMFTIGPLLGSFMQLLPVMLDSVDAIYKNEQKRHFEANGTAKNEAGQYVNELSKRAAAETQATKSADTGRETPADKSQV